MGQRLSTVHHLLFVISLIILYHCPSFSISIIREKFMLPSSAPVAKLGSLPNWMDRKTASSCRGATGKRNHWDIHEREKAEFSARSVNRTAWPLGKGLRIRRAPKEYHCDLVPVTEIEYPRGKRVVEAAADSRGEPGSRSISRFCFRGAAEEPRIGNKSTVWSFWQFFKNFYLDYCWLTKNDFGRLSPERDDNPARRGRMHFKARDGAGSQSR